MTRLGTSPCLNSLKKALRSPRRVWTELVMRQWTFYSQISSKMTQLRRQLKLKKTLVETLLKHRSPKVRLNVKALRNSRLCSSLLLTAFTHWCHRFRRKVLLLLLLLLNKIAFSRPRASSAASDHCRMKSQSNRAFSNLAWRRVTSQLNLINNLHMSRPNGCQPRSTNPMVWVLTSQAIVLTRTKLSSIMTTLMVPSLSSRWTSNHCIKSRRTAASYPCRGPPPAFPTPHPLPSHKW